MKIYWDFFEKDLDEHIIVIGNFDGIHLGHLKLLRTAKKKIKPGLKLGVITFFPHPESVIKARSDNFFLTTYDEKIKLLENEGVDTIFFIEFSSLFSKLSPNEFIEKLIEITNIKEVIIGKNFRFGHFGKGNASYLKKKLQEFSIKTHAISLYKKAGEIISSTLIRNCIYDGEIKTAEKYLGREYLLCGTVLRGKQLGRILGFPTVNIDVQNKIVPANGVYKGMAYYSGKSYFALIFIGNSSFNSTDDIIIEAWLDKFDKEIYGEEICLHIEKFLRKPKKIDNVKELKDLIIKDYHKAQNEN
ncbi:bifunctional riboflavin kinase/FAD synthetase [bacterium]|nr:bifunctional riboflavin kinase/FAD synthetase [bacterium]